MSEQKNLHTSNLGWFVWIENTINNVQMMTKSLTWISLAGFGAAAAAALVTTTIGVWDTKLSFEFYSEFFGLSFEAIFNTERRAFWWQAFEAIAHDQLLLFLVHSPVAIYVWVTLYKKISKKSQEMAETQFIKGTKLIPETKRVSHLLKLMEEGKMKSRFRIGRIPMPRESECNHTVIIAASGGGKGVLLTKIMLAAGSLKSIKGIVHDIKPEWILMGYRPDRGDLIFNPLDERSIKWTIWNDIHDVMDIKNFALWIVPSSGDPKGAFWEDSARGILESILLFLWNHNDYTNAAIRQMINLPGKELAKVLEGYPGAEYAAKKDSLATLKTQMQWVDFLPDGDFSIRKWINEVDRGLLFLSNTEKTQALFKPVLSLFVNAVGSHVLNLPDDRERRFYFFLDEFTALTRLDKVIDLLKLGRSKGASLWLAFQDFQQLEKIYSKEDMRTIINNCKNIAVGQIQEPDAAKYLASRFGRQEFYEKSQTFSMGVADNRDGLSLNEQRKEDFVVKDTDLLNLEERQFYVKINHLEGVTLTTADIIEVEKIAVGFVQVEMSKEEQIGMMLARDKSNLIQSKLSEQANDNEIESEGSLLDEEVDPEKENQRSEEDLF